MLTVACVQVGNYCGHGAKYVNKLLEMVRMHLTRPFRFVCVTDDGTGLDPSIEIINSPGVKGWWNKLYLFEVFHQHTLFLDLDTILLGNIDFLADYEGRFAMLRDFYRKDGFGSGLMAWNGDLSHIWHDWNKAGRPELAGGDQEWIERVEAPDAWQALYPNRIKSFKADNQVTPEAPVICFHGYPKPHEIEGGWVRDIWNGSSLMPIKWQEGLNNDPSVMLEQFRRNLDQNVPFLAPRPPQKAAMLLVGGGPSLQDTLGKLRFHKARGGEIYALNGTHDWLIDRGIIPDYLVLLDSRESNLCFVQKPHKDVKYLVSAFCHPSIFEALKGFDVTLWMSDMEGAEPLVKHISDKPVVLIGGGATVGMKSMFLGHVRGHRTFHFFGFDSSYRDEKNHAYPQPMNDKESRVEIVAGGKKFTCAPWMAKQANEFQQQARQLLQLGCRLTVHGDGLIPWIMEIWNADRNRRCGPVG